MILYVDALRLSTNSHKAMKETARSLNKNKPNLPSHFCNTRT